MIIKFDRYFEEFEDKVWYHGSYSHNINQFIVRRDKMRNKMGSYFSDTMSEAKRYGSYIYKVKLYTTKTLDLTKYGEYGFDNYEMLLKQLPISEREVESMVRNIKFWDRPWFSPYTILESLDKKFDIVPKLKKRGYDSIKFKEGIGTTIVVFWSSLIEIIDKNELI